MRPLLGYKMRATNVTMAFFLNSLFLAVVAVLTFVIHDYMTEMHYFTISKNMTASQRIVLNLRLYLILLLCTFLIGCFTYGLLFILFGFGGGLLAVSQSPLIDKKGDPSWLTHAFYGSRKKGTLKMKSKSSKK
jgi:hypothetical protein